MKKRKLSLLTLAALFFLCVIASQTEAKPFILSKVVDTSTPIPGGLGNFTYFSYGLFPPYMVSGNNVAFQAGGESEQYGIYLFNGTTITKVADYNTPIPGGSENFTIFFSSYPVISDNDVAFHGGGGSGHGGIYLFNGTILSKVVDTNTPIPGGFGNFTNFDNFYNPVISGNEVALTGYGLGQHGVYLFNGNSLNKVADYNTPVPEGLGNFVSFYSLGISGGNVAFQGGGAGQDGIYLFNGTALTKVVDSNTPPWSGSIPTFSVPVISGGNVAFRAGNAEQSGIYLFNETILSTVADTNTPIPGGSGNFTSFSDPVISNGNVAFQGIEYWGQDGIYLFNGTTLSKVADTNTPIPSGSGNFTSFSAPVISNGNVAFTAFGTGQQQGIYLFNGTTLSKVADTNTLIPSGSGNFTGFSDPVINDGKVAFGAAGTGQQGIYLASTVMDLVTDYYNNILDRAPEPGGAEGWTAEIERIISLGIDINEGFIAVGKSFFNSAEYLLMAKTDAAYVTDLYETFLQRPPVQAEIDYWVGYLTQGMSRNIALYYFVYSAEFKLYMEGIFGVGGVRPENNLVNDFYRGILNRLPDTAGFNAWLGLMRTAQCTGAQQVRDLSHQIALGFIQSAEYVARGRTNSEYVEDLYDAILRRGALPAEVSAWETLLNTATREQVLQGFTNSPEFQIRVTEVINAGCL